MNVIRYVKPKPVVEKTKQEKIKFAEAMSIRDKELRRIEWLEKSKGVCPVCHMYRSMNGTCGCD